ncbi:hypothetical protein AAHB56_07200, partial [Bacillus thuringiensis]
YFVQFSVQVFNLQDKPSYVFFAFIVSTMFFRAPLQAVMEWADTFALYYPTSRLSIIDKGEGMSGIGIQPHIHISWTPEHIQEDVDLKLALQLLQNEEW